MDSWGGGGSGRMKWVRGDNGAGWLAGDDRRVRTVWPHQYCRQE